MNKEFGGKASDLETVSACSSEGSRQAVCIEMCQESVGEWWVTDAVWRGQGGGTPGRYLRSFSDLNIESLMTGLGRCFSFVIFFCTTLQCLFFMPVYFNSDALYSCNWIQDGSLLSVIAVLFCHFDETFVLCFVLVHAWIAWAEDCFKYTDSVLRQQTWGENQTHRLRVGANSVPSDSNPVIISVKNIT